jgi:hypothetical protein
VQRLTDDTPQAPVRPEASAPETLLADLHILGAVVDLHSNRISRTFGASSDALTGQKMLGKHLPVVTVRIVLVAHAEITTDRGTLVSSMTSRRFG